MRFLARLLVMPIALSIPFVVHAAVVFNSGNGHYYGMNADFGLPDATWPTANVAAQTVTFAGTTGHLATLTSAAESIFISQNFTAIPGVPIAFGLFQNPAGAEPAGGWQWVTGELFGFSNWASGEPNNCCGVEEDFGFFSAPTNANGYTWNDASNTGATSAYLIEFSVPEPGTLLLLSLALMMFAASARRRSATKLAKIFR